MCYRVGGIVMGLMLLIKWLGVKLLVVGCVEFMVFRVGSIMVVALCCNFHPLDVFAL